MREIWNIVQMIFAAVGAQGIFKKVVIFSLVGVAHIIDQNVIGDDILLINFIYLIFFKKIEINSKTQKLS